MAERIYLTCLKEHNDGFDCFITSNMKRIILRCRVCNAEIVYLLKER